MRILFYILFFGLSIQSVNAQKNDTLLQADFLKDLESKLKANSDLAFEYLCAQKFHVLINEYRVSKKIEELDWSDVLWLTARNHAIWMRFNGRLSHTQSKKMPFFSGFNPFDRLKYVHPSFKIQCGWGENALTNGFTLGEKDDAAAQQIAEICFDQWKHSREHNANMLTRSYKSHGFSFSSDSEGNFYACDVFLEVGNKKK